MSEAPRRRPVSTEPEGAEERSGCLRIAAILGIVIGIPAGVFGLPAALNYFFDEPTVEVGDRYDEDGLKVSVAAVATAEGPPRTVTITLDVTSETPWAPRLADFELELDSGDRAVAESPEPTLSPFAEGETGTVTLRFVLTQAGEASPEALHVADPKVRFELPEPVP